jgi:ABC-type Fe3+/spermidine/putrescine transport system ATPase subunit
MDIPLGPTRPSVRLRSAGAEGVSPGQRITLSIRPEDIALHLSRPDRTVNVIEGEVIDTVYLGSFLDGQVRVGAHTISVQIDHYERLVPGQKVFLTFEPEHERDPCRIINRWSQ